MRILVVEDESSAAQMIAKGLRECAYAVDVAEDGEAALSKLGENDYDLVILDVLLPKVNGLRVCRELRAQKVAVPILMLSARDAHTDRVLGLDAGADDYLTKPFDFGELVARIRALLRRGPVLASESLRIGNLRLDLRTRRVQRGSEDIKLTSKEYALLEYLARNAHRVVGRAEISEHVWEENFDPFSNLIEVYVQRLRRKIDHNQAEKLLRTVRGEGYMLTASSTNSA